MQVLITSDANAEMNALPLSVRERVRNVVDRLQRWPAVSGVKELRGELAGYARIRVGDWRVIFRLPGKEIVIVKVDNRRNVYGGKRSSRSPTRRLLNASTAIGESMAKDIKLARLDAGLTQMQLAAKIGVSQAMVAGVETGRIRVGQKYIRILLKVCRQPADYPRHRRIITVGIKRAASPRKKKL